jgi:ParB family chromosome partitioning protein
MTLPLDDLDLLLTPTDLLTGAPLQLRLDAIDEDPDQPRREFDTDGLAELAETIKERGVRQPVSVRRHPTQPDRWMLNFGARRLRASKLAGKDEIPAFVDHTADSYDQVVENEQREGLKPLELALFIQRRMATGESQAEIAKRLGKSRQYIMIATALIEAPDWLLSAYREGRCRGMNELHELRKLHGQHPQYVEAWASDRDAITRERLQALRAALAEGSASVHATVSTLMKVDQAAVDRPAAADSPTRVARPTFVQSPQRQRLQASVDGLVVWIDTDAVPSQPGQVFVHGTGADTESRREVEASRLTLLGFGPA